MQDRARYALQYCCELFSFVREEMDVQPSMRSSLEPGEGVLRPGSFPVNKVTQYDFTPYNTPLRIEKGQAAELHRMYMP